ncbi:sugar-binding protein [Alteromonas sp. ASW11-36]|uniref:Sugar-binding protein n=1 Tax=Alteromonas arenosi TaxID=3055817 RepID=A0ABT7SZG9_9ALTE|nr:sugar-binding protein [Alteromonas sp. ASW11-36]MDM7861575.1 sugar-binding protein [Alteromonas sp. ASW11-36]
MQRAWHKAGLVVSIGLLCVQANADEAIFAKTAPTIDGSGTDTVWQNASWYPIDFPIIGDLPAKSDFSGRYKLAWDENALYLLAEIQDDVLFDQNPDPKIAYWDDDCLEIFIDADASGGIHLNDYNAFAYHVGLDNQVSDIGPDEQGGGTPIVLNDHIDSQWLRAASAPFMITWELKINIYADDFHHKRPTQPIALSANKEMGFMLAYCDNDGSKHRENFIGSHPIEAVEGDKNRGYIDASVFDRLKLIP